MLTIFADAMMTATRTSTCGGWPDCADQLPPRGSKDNFHETSHQARSKWKQILGIW